MKRILLALAFLATATIAAAQAPPSVDCSNLNLKTDGGIQCTSGQAVVAPKVSTTAPTSPYAGQLWVDTTPASPTCKYWNGSAWTACSTISVLTTQNDLSSFPAGSVDGQVFLDWSHCTMWAYRLATTAWYVIGSIGPCSASTSNIVDNFTGSTITNPSGAITIASSGTAGNSTAGTHVCSVTFANASGGETTPGTTASASVSITGSKSIDFSGLPLGGTGTTARRLYCSKATTSTPKYWIGTVGDNSSTTSTQASLADANMVLIEPATNYSAPLNARWTVTNNSTATTSGGCGSTGGSIMCRVSNAKSVNISALTADTGIMADTDITSYSSGNYTIQYRVVGCNAGPAINFAAGNCSFGGMSVGNNYASGPIGYQMLSNQGLSGPLSATNNMYMNTALRTTLAGSMSASGSGVQNFFPKVSSFPFWVRIVKTGSVMTYYASKDGSTAWTNLITQGTSPAANPTDTTLGQVPSSAYTFFRWWIAASTTGADQLMEFDTFSLTVNP